MSIEVVSYIKSDLERLDNVSLKNFIRWYCFPQGSTFPHTVWFRLLQWSKTTTFKKYTIGLIAYFFERHYTHKYGIHANTNIPVGKGFKVVHGNGVFLNCKSIGNNFTVYQCVTLGQDKGGIPTVEDDVTIYPGAVLVGNITLHSGCVVGANSFVNHDVPCGAVVAGVPGKIIKYNN